MFLILVTLFNFIGYAHHWVPYNLGRTVHQFYRSIDGHWYLKTQENDKWFLERSKDDGQTFEIVKTFLRPRDLAWLTITKNQSDILYDLNGRAGLSLLTEKTDEMVLKVNVFPKFMTPTGHVITVHTEPVHRPDLSDLIVNTNPHDFNRWEIIRVDKGFFHVYQCPETKVTYVSTSEGVFELDLKEKKLVYLKDSPKNLSRGFFTLDGSLIGVDNDNHFYQMKKRDESWETLDLPKPLKFDFHLSNEVPLFLIESDYHEIKFEKGKLTLEPTGINVSLAPSVLGSFRKNGLLTVVTSNRLFMQKVPVKLDLKFKEGEVVKLKSKTKMIRLRKGQTVENEFFLGETLMIESNAVRAKLKQKEVAIQDKKFSFVLQEGTTEVELFFD